MRVINLDQLRLPEDWQDRAHKAAADGFDRIAGHGELWRELKDPLKFLSNRKCYYCEVIQERSDGTVDHFRPKKKYPWSAFTPSNYRFACTFCNSRRTDEENERTGGKGDNFPVFYEDSRATCCEAEENECPILLDPCRPDEPGLLDFDETGTPQPTYSKEEHSGRNLRAEVSIRLYHLDHADLVDRRKALAINITRKIRAAERLFPYTESGNASVDASFSEHVRFLADSISESAELSAFARRILSGYRNIRWVDSLICSA